MWMKTLACSLSLFCCLLSSQGSPAGELITSLAHSFPIGVSNPFHPSKPRQATQPPLIIPSPLGDLSDQGAGLQRDQFVAANRTLSQGSKPK